MVLNVMKLVLSMLSNGMVKISRLNILFDSIYFWKALIVNECIRSSAMTQWRLYQVVLRRKMRRRRKIL